MDQTIQERREEFQTTTHDELLEPAARALVIFGLTFGTIFGPSAAAQALRRIHDDAGLQIEEEEETSVLYAPGDWPRFAPQKLRRSLIYRHLLNLKAYAVYGLPIEDLLDSETNDIGDEVRWRRARIEKLVAAFAGTGGQTAQEDQKPTLPTEHLFGREVQTLVLAAAARWKLDDDENDAPLTLDELASLAGVSLKSVRNAVTPSSSERIHTLEDGSVSQAEASRWLRNRRDYRPSVWQLADAQSIDPADGRHAEPLLDDVVFVPVARDGTAFTPELMRNGAFRIGPRLAEQQYGTYLEALGALQRMHTPMWRRPNRHGNWGIVTGVNWVRKTRKELGL